MGRPPKRASERKNQYVSLSVEKSRLKLYQEAAKAGFNGNMSDFLRAAADALAEQIKAPPADPPAD